MTPIPAKWCLLLRRVCTFIISCKLSSYEIKLYLQTKGCLPLHSITLNIFTLKHSPIRQAADKTANTLMTIFHNPTLMNLFVSTFLIGHRIKFSRTNVWKHLDKCVRLSTWLVESLLKHVTPNLEISGKLETYCSAYWLTKNVFLQIRLLSY